MNFQTVNNQILQYHSTVITVTAKDSSGNLITIGGEFFFSVNSLPMTDNSDGTYTYPYTFNDLGMVDTYIFIQFIRNDHIQRGNAKSRRSK